MTEAALWGREALRCRNTSCGFTGRREWWLSAPFRQLTLIEEDPMVQTPTGNLATTAEKTLVQEIALLKQRIQQQITWTEQLHTNANQLTPNVGLFNQTFRQVHDSQVDTMRDLGLMEQRATSGTYGVMETKAPGGGIGRGGSP